jgi:cytoskeletal protein CcmA (bactofilin family)
MSQNFFSSKEKTSPNASLNVLIKESLINGEINTPDDIRIDGTLNGNLYCKARVVLGSSGLIKGNIFCSSALIEGKVTGNIESKNALDIRSTALVEGDILSSKLIMEEGAKFNGHCKMIPAYETGKP